MAIPRRTPLLSLMRLEAQHVASLKVILNEAVKELDDKIAGMEGKNPITVMQAKAQREAMNDFLNRTFDTVEDVARVGMQAAAGAASLVVSQYEDELLKLVLDKDTMKALAKSEAQRAASGLEAALKRMQGTSYIPLSEQIYKTKQLSSGWVDNLINKGLALGWSQRELANELRKSISPNVPGGVSYAANRTARTEINNAYHASAAERYANSAIVDGVDWNLSSSHPEGDICDTLADESPYDKKNVPQKPHPFCYCFLTPALPTEDEFMENLFSGKYDGDDPTSQALQESIKLTEKDITDGMAAAEAQRKAFERGHFDRKGNFNKANGWDSETQKAWTSYIEMGHKDMNAFLRNPSAFAEEMANDPFWIELADKESKLVAELISKNQTTRDMVVGRGVTTSPGFDPSKLKPGELFADPAFLSTTTNMDEALNFAAGRGREGAGEGWTFITKVPKGTNAIDGADYQSEIVFGPGQLQRVTSIDADNRIIYTEMTS